MSNLIKFFYKSPKYTIKWSNYFNVYEEVLKKYRYKKIKFVEVGIGGGGSLFMWKSFFKKKAEIIGIDLNPEAKRLEKYGFKIAIGDQGDPNFWKKFYKKYGKIDVLLDDGGHKNIQQVTTLMESINFIKPSGTIIIEDTHTSFMKKKGFKNPSKYSLINFSNSIIENIHRQNPSINKKPNYISEKVESISFYDSIVCFNFFKKEKKTQSKLIENNRKLRKFFTDYRHQGDFIRVKKKLEDKVGKINKNTFLYSLIRNIFHRNVYSSIIEKLRIIKYKNSIKN